MLIRRRDDPETERAFAEWLAESTDDELLTIAKQVRRLYCQRLDAYDEGGDGAMVNAMCAAARAIFSPGLRW